MEYEQQQLEVVLNQKFSEISLKVCINKECEFIPSSIPNTHYGFRKPGTKFGVIYISLANKQEKIENFTDKFKLLFPDIKFAIEDNCLVIDQLNPAELLMKVQNHNVKVKEDEITVSTTINKMAR